jgi:hypothetical protein
MEAFELAEVAAHELRRIAASSSMSMEAPEFSDEPANFEFDELEAARQLVEEDLDVFAARLQARLSGSTSNPGLLQVRRQAHLGREKTSDQDRDSSTTASTAT